MATSFEQAVEALYRAAHDAFVAERKRLAGELKGAGDKAGAARLAKLGRPPISAWAVNQLWWQERDEIEKLLAAAARLRKGDQTAATPRRDSLAALKARASSILERAGHAPNEGTLRRVTTTLAALAAAGGFEPDAPGALSADRDPPGFDIAGLAATLGAGASEAAPAASTGVATAPVEGRAEAAATPARESVSRVASFAALPEPIAPLTRGEPSASSGQREGNAQREEGAAERAAADAREEGAAKRAAADAESAARRAEQERQEAVQRAERDRRAAAQRAEEERQEAERRAERERVRLEVERAAQRAERQRLEASLPALRGDLERRLREVERLRAEVARVEQLAEQARAAVAEAESRLTTLRPD